MRIVLINRYFYPDQSETSELLSGLAFECVNWGFDVSVVTSRQWSNSASKRLPEFETVKGVEITRVSGMEHERHGNPAALFSYFSFLFAVRKKLKEIVDRGTVVIVNTDPPLLGTFVIGSVLRQGGILVNWLQDLFPEAATASWPDPIARWGLAPLRYLRNGSLKRAGLNIATGRSMRDYLLSEGVSYGRLWVIRNWSHAIPVEQGHDHQDYRSNWGLTGKFVIGCFGGLDQTKEYETILGAMMALESKPNVVFLFVGPGPWKALKKEANKHDLRNLIFRDPVPRRDLTAALRSADVHLVALEPRMEGYAVSSEFPKVSAAGRPVLYIGDPKGEVGRIVRKGKCGYIFEPGDSQGLAEAVRRFIEDPLTLTAMGNAASQVHLKYYRAEELFRRWHVVLNAMRQRITAVKRR